MLSIIISSYKPDYFSALEKNIAETCGIPYEIIKIDNPGVMGICEAYNKGAAKARYEYLLFLHEDVEFTDKNWGSRLEEYLKNSEIGAIGLAGSNYLPNCPSPWWLYKENNFLNLTQNNKKDLIGTFDLEKDEEVISLDGVFLALRKNVFKQFKFNEKLKGFHAYDIDLSNRVASTYKNMVTSKIFLKHFSQGVPDKSWIEALIHARKFYSVPNKQKKNYQKEVTAVLHLYKNLCDFGFDRGYIKRTLLTYSSPFKIGFRGSYYMIKKIISI